MKDGIMKYVLSYARIIVGSALYAVGFQFFCYPNDIVAGGVTGIAMTINYLTQLPVGVLTIIMNIPLFAVSWKKFGLGFIIASLTGMLFSSVFVDLLSILNIAATREPLLGAIYGGVIKGLGLGLVYSVNATTGGVDIVAKFLRRKYQYINFGTIILALDIAVIAVFTVVFGRLESALYSVICLFLSSQVIDFVLYGAVNSKVCYIITDESDKIKETIVKNLNRGATLIKGEGAWSGKGKNIILCVIKRNQIVELRRAVKAIDERAFMIVSDSREVFGKGFTYIGDLN